MSKTAFQVGISWRVVESKWPGIKEASHGFDAERVAGMTEPEIETLTQDIRVIRNRRKLEAVVSNANPHGGACRDTRLLPEVPALPRGLSGYLPEPFRALGDPPM
jgi:hypothetical protein